MSYTHTFTPVYASGGGQTSLALTQTSGAETNVSESIPAASTDLVVAWGQDISQIKSLLVMADGALTVKTYLATVLKDTITLAANVPLVWQADWCYTLAEAGFAYDFDQVKVTNGSSTTAVTLSVRCLYDPTV